MFRIIDAVFSIPRTSEEAALEHLTDSFEVHADTIDQAFKELGFELVRNDRSEIAAVSGESQEFPHDDIDNVFRAVAPYVIDGSSVTFEDGEGARWRYSFRAKRCVRHDMEN